MTKRCQRGTKGFSKSSPSNRSQRNGGFFRVRRVMKGGVAPPPPPPQLQTNADTIQLIVGGGSGIELDMSFASMSSLSTDVDPPLQLNCQGDDDDDDNDMMHCSSSSSNSKKQSSG